MSNDAKDSLSGDIGFREVDWVSSQLGLDRNTVYRYLNEGRLPGLQLGKKWLVEEQGLRDFLRREQKLQTERRQAAAWSSELSGEVSWDGTVTFVFSDLVGSSAYIDKHSDEEWAEVMQGHNRVLREVLPADGRSAVKLIGDGFMVAFSSAADALRFSRDFVTALERRESESADSIFPVRIGIHAGEVRHEDGEFLGRTVFIAAHINGIARPGEVLVSAVVKDLVDEGTFVFDEGREVDLKVGGRRRVYGLIKVPAGL